MEFLATLKDTPLPTILVVGGFVFLFIGIATIKKPFVISVNSSQRKMAIIVGGILVFLGLVLFFLPTSEQSSKTSTQMSIKITKPTDNATIICDTTLGTDQCYISITGTADIEPKYGVCLFLKFQGSPDSWWVGGQISANEIPDSKVWKVSHVGIGNIEGEYLPALLITATITDEPCSIGTQFADLPESVKSTTIQVQRK